MDEFRYSSEKLNEKTIVQEIDAFWKDLREDAALQQWVQNQEFNLEKLQEIDSKNAITVHTSGAGLDPASTAIIISFSPVAAKIVSDLWTRVILPRILHKWGDGALERSKD